MLYQNQLTGNLPYSLWISNIDSFPMHIHHEIEMIYAFKNDVDVKINNVRYKIPKGKAALIGSMVMHEICQGQAGRMFLDIEMGTAFLKEKFKLVMFLDFKIKIFDTEKHADIYNCLNNLLENQLKDEEYFDLWNIGYLFQLYAMFCKALKEDDVNSMKISHTSNTKSIEKSLKFVYEHYNEDISVDDAAAYCGYCKSGFCKAFKNITGLTFHNYLNLCRIKNSQFLLTETDFSLEEIAESVGLKDSKTFCRLFKKITDLTPRHYRMENKMIMN